MQASVLCRHARTVLTFVKFGSGCPNLNLACGEMFPPGPYRRDPSDLGQGAKIIGAVDFSRYFGPAGPYPYIWSGRVPIYRSVYWRREEEGVRCA